MAKLATFGNVESDWRSLLVCAVLQFLGEFPTVDGTPIVEVQHCVFPRDAAFAFSCGLVERVESECLLEVDVTVELPVLIVRALLQSALASSTSLTRIHDFNASFTREREKNGWGQVVGNNPRHAMMLDAQLKGRVSVVSDSLNISLNLVHTQPIFRGSAHSTISPSPSGGFHPVGYWPI